MSTLVSEQFQLKTQLAVAISVFHTRQTCEGSSERVRATSEFQFATT
jgi:hypothetical protein